MLRSQHQPQARNAQSSRNAARCAAATATFYFVDRRTQPSSVSVSMAIGGSRRSKKRERSSKLQRLLRKTGKRPVMREFRLHRALDGARPPLPPTPCAPRRTPFRAFSLSARRRQRCRGRWAGMLRHSRSESSALAFAALAVSTMRLCASWNSAAEASSDRQSSDRRADGVFAIREAALGKCHRRGRLRCQSWALFTSGL
jgi:hypothetical protein